MIVVCPKCGRERDDSGVFMALLSCPGEDDPVCFVVAAAYQRGRRDGIDEGVRLAKEWVEVEELHGHEYVNFENVERKAEKAKERTP